MFYDICLNDLFYIEKEKKNCTLSKYNKKEIENFEGGKVSILQKKQNILEFVASSKTLNSNAKLYFGKISTALASKIRKETGLNTEGYNVSLMSHSVKHIIKKHGNSLEILRGQIPITDKNFTHIEDIITNYDSLELSKTKQQNIIAITFKKEILGTYNLVVYISNKNKNLEIKTLYLTQSRKTTTYSI